MSKPVVITADSTVDLSRELIERFHIHIIPLTITLGEESFQDGFGFTPLPPGRDVAQNLRARRAGISGALLAFCRAGL